jgi:hypothetical protein
LKEDWVTWSTDMEYPERNLLIDPEGSEESEETIISSIKSRYNSISSLEREFRTQILTLVARQLRIISYHRERRHQLLTRLSRRLRALSQNNAPRMVDFEIADIMVTAKVAKNASKANPAVHSKTEQSGMDEASRSKIYEQSTTQMKSGFFKRLPPTMTDPSKQLSQYQNIDTVITNMGECFKTYDMDDVWNIVYPTDVAVGPDLETDEAGKAITKNLFTEDANIDIKEFAKAEFANLVFVCTSALVPYLWRLASCHHDIASLSYYSRSVHFPLETLNGTPCTPGYFLGFSFSVTLSDINCH